MLEGTLEHMPSPFYLQTHGSRKAHDMPMGTCYCLKPDRARCPDSQKSAGVQSHNNYSCVLLALKVLTAIEGKHDFSGTARPRVLNAHCWKTSKVPSLIKMIHQKENVANREGNSHRL